MYKIYAAYEDVKRDIGSEANVSDGAWEQDN